MIYKLFLVSVLWSFNLISNSTLNEYTNNSLNKIAQSAYSTLPTIYNTYFIACECLKNNILGDFVECGVAAGAQVGVMGYACKQIKSPKKIHLFDSFEGIPLASKFDTEQPGVGKITHEVEDVNLNDLLISSGVAVHSIENVKKNILLWGLNLDRFIFYKGWFQHTLPARAYEIDSISFLRLDGDLYESTKICLEYFYPKISKGGYIVIDDYALNGCKKAVDEYLTFYNIVPNIISVPGGLGPVYWQIN